MWDPLVLPVGLVGSAESALDETAHRWPPGDPLWRWCRSPLQSKGAVSPDQMGALDGRGRHTAQGAYPQLVSWPLMGAGSLCGVPLGDPPPQEKGSFKLVPGLDGPTPECLGHGVPRAVALERLRASWGPRADGTGNGVEQG